MKRTLSSDEPHPFRFPMNKIKSCSSKNVGRGGQNRPQPTNDCKLLKSGSKTPHVNCLEEFSAASQPKTSLSITTNISNVWLALHQLVMLSSRTESLRVIAVVRTIQSLGFQARFLACKVGMCRTASSQNVLSEDLHVKKLNDAYEQKWGEPHQSTGQHRRGMLECIVLILGARTDDPSRGETSRRDHLSLLAMPVRLA